MSCGYVYYTLVGMRVSTDVYSYILREASALLVQLIRAMRRPLSVGRVTVTGSHAFLFYIVIYLRAVVQPITNYRLTNFK